ncbi:MAG: hypothetical protein AAGA48_13645 [Myxococcota bacterium]
MNEKHRRVLLVGSLPFENEETAMTKALEVVGDRLVMALPDGEIGEHSEAYPLGERAAWVQVIIDRCMRDEAAFRVIREGERGESGFPTGYDKGPRLAPRHAPSALFEHLDFGWLDAFRKNYPVFKRLREAHNLPNLKLQVGLPTGIGMTFAMMSPVNALRYAPTFDRRMAFEANAILDEADEGDIAFQLEVPGNLALAYQLPDLLHGFPAGGVVRLLRQVRPAVPFGVHLCFGDLNNEALIKAGSIRKAVSFANALLARWPDTYELRYLHIPLAEAATPPPLDPDFYKPLAKLAMPEGVRLVAGFVHPELDDDDHDTLLSIVEQHRGHAVDVACSCGMGRMSATTAERLLELSSRLTRPNA